MLLIEGPFINNIFYLLIFKKVGFLFEIDTLLSETIKSRFLDSKIDFAH